MYRRRVPKVPYGTSTKAPVLTQKVAAVAVEEPEEKEKENHIESSQEHNQSQFNATQGGSRFKSQRATIARLTQHQREQGKKSFEIVLYNNDLEFTEIGCELIDANRDPISFIRSFRCFLTSQNDCQQRIQQYLSDFHDEFDLANDEKLEKCEKFMRGIFLRDGDQKYQTQTSVVMCMLAIDGFKAELTRILLRNLKSYVSTKGEDASPIVVGLVLTQFKFTDQILDAATYDFLFEELFEILLQTQPFECRDVVVSHFRELSVLKQEEAARRLFGLYEKNESELLRFLDRLCDMSMDEATATGIFGVIQRQMRAESAETLHYPAMIKYSQFYSQSAEELVQMFREHIRWRSCERATIEEVFELIEKLFKRDHLCIIEKWTNAIAAVASSDEISPIDFVILLKIADTNTETELRNVKKIVVDMIGRGLLSNNYLKQSFKMFYQIINENSQTLLELLDGLQKTRDNSILYGFLATCYKLLFRVTKDAKPIIGSLVNFLCEKRPSLPFASSSSSAPQSQSSSEFKLTILSIFNDVMQDRVTSAAALLAHHKILLRAFDSTKIELSFHEHRLFMEFLCALAFKIDVNAVSAAQRRCISENADALREHLNMRLSKHLAFPEERIKRLALIGGVKIVSALAEKSVAAQDDVAESEDLVSVESLPRGDVRDAIELLHWMLTACDGAEEIMATLLDELADEFRAKSKLNRTFMSWTGALFLNRLEEFVLTSVTAEHSDIAGRWRRLVNKFEMHDDQFESQEHAVNLSNIVLRDRSKNILVIPAVFRLARVINGHRYGSVEFMAGLCAMPLVLPENFATDEDNIWAVAPSAVPSKNLEATTLSEDEGQAHRSNKKRRKSTPSDDETQAPPNESKRVTTTTTTPSEEEEAAALHLDLYFHTCNWFRELIGAFITKDESLLKLVKGRLKQLMRIESKLDDLLVTAPKNYLPPFIGFSQNPEKRKAWESAMRKKVGGKEEEDGPPKRKKAKRVCEEKIPTKRVRSREFCREIDGSIARLLNEKFDLKSSSSNESELEFGLEELLYLLTEVHEKVTKSLRNNRAEDLDFVASVLPKFVRIFAKINAEIDALANASLEIDSEGNSVPAEEDPRLQRAFALVLDTFSLVFANAKLKQEENSQSLAKMLKIIVGKDTAHLNSDRDLICAAIVEKFVDIEKNAKTLASAVALLDFLATINGIAKDRVTARRLSAIAEKMLKTRWTDENRRLEQGAAANAKLEKLVKLYVRKAANVQALREIVEEMREITKLSDLAAHSKTFPCISRSNLIFLLRACVRRHGEILASSTKSHALDFEFWSTNALLECDFIETVKWIKSQAAFSLFLRSFTTFLRKFNCNGMNFLGDLARTDRASFVQLVKEIQRIRRLAHGVACELKHLKNNGIAAILPNVRQQFETFYQAASGISTKSNLPPDAFCTGPLRNFGIDGEDIFSQNIATGSSGFSGGTESGNEEEEMEVSDSGSSGSDDDDDEGEKVVTSDKNKSSVSLRSRSTIF